MLVVQCVACAVLVLVLWLFSRFGSAAANQLRDYLKLRLEDNSVATAVSLWMQDLADEERVDFEKTNVAFVSTSTVHLSDGSDTVLPIDPNKGTVTSAFGNRNNPTATGEEFHKGLDIAAERGTPIAAMRFGVVTDTGEDKWLGNYVVLSHGNLNVTYAHCSTVAVNIGDIVKAGETVATVGNSGNSTGNHLHIEIYQDGFLCDPAEIVKVSAYD